MAGQRKQLTNPGDNRLMKGQQVRLSSRTRTVRVADLAAVSDWSNDQFPLYHLSS